MIPSQGLRVGSQRAILAKFPNGNPELSAVHMDSGSIPYGPGRYLNGSGRSMQIPTYYSVLLLSLATIYDIFAARSRYFSRAHAPVNTTKEFWARPSVHKHSVCSL